MRPNDVTRILEEVGAIRQGHFELTSGLHSATYVQCALVLQYPKYAEQLGRALAAEFMDLRLDCVASPALGGVILGHEVARAAGLPFLFTERDGAGKMTLRRGFSVRPGETAVVIEDVVTTGGSTREVIKLLQEMGVKVAAAGSIIDRSGGSVDLGVPRFALATLQVKAWEPESCPLCRQGIPVVKPGSRPSA